MSLSEARNKTSMKLRMDVVASNKIFPANVNVGTKTKPDTIEYGPGYAIAKWLDWQLTNFKIIKYTVQGKV